MSISGLNFKSVMKETYRTTYHTIKPKLNKISMIVAIFHHRFESGIKMARMSLMITKVNVMHRAAHIFSNTLFLTDSAAWIGSFNTW